jgi:hypothetical protein
MGSAALLQTTPTSSITSLFFGHLLNGYEDKQEEKAKKKEKKGQPEKW